MTVFDFDVESLWEFTYTTGFTTC